MYKTDIVLEAQDSFMKFAVCEFVVRYYIFNHMCVTCRWVGKWVSTYANVINTGPRIFDEHMCVNTADCLAFQGECLECRLCDVHIYLLAVPCVLNGNRLGYFHVGYWQKAAIFVEAKLTLDNFLVDTYTFYDHIYVQHARALWFLFYKLFN